jgi:hypothetical protein
MPQLHAAIDPADRSRQLPGRELTFSAPERNARPQDALPFGEVG